MSTPDTEADRCPGCGGLNHQKYGHHVHTATPDEIADLRRAGLLPAIYSSKSPEAV